MTQSQISQQHELVLNAIDVISFRKNRPNIARIFRHLVRFTNITLATCEKLLNELVAESRVIKVTYKGNISYRNAAKWKNIKKFRKKSEAEKKSAAVRRVSSLFSGTVAELALRVPAYLDSGVPCKVLEDHLLTKDGRFTKESIHKLLQRELQQKTLVQLDNGNYFLGINKNPVMNSLTSEDSTDSKNLPEMEDEKKEDNKGDEDIMEQSENIEDFIEEEIEEVEYDDNDDDDDEDEENEDEDFDDDEDDTNEVEEECDEVEELEEEEEEEEEKLDDEMKPRLQDVSAESDVDSIANDSFHQDKDYLPPRRLSVNTRRSSSGRLSVRNKKTRYDASEYFFPSLNKRTYKSRQEKTPKSGRPKGCELLNSKEFKRALLTPTGSTNASVSGSSTANPIKRNITPSLAKNRLPDMPLKRVQFGTADTFSGHICSICNDTKVPVPKTTGARCKICQRRAHAACVKTEQNISKLNVEAASWTCVSCRFILAQPCCVCYQSSSKMETVVICGTCKLSYHKKCHQPPIVGEEVLTGSWRCNNCITGIKPQDSGGNLHSLPKIGTITAQRINKEDNTPDGKLEEPLIDETKDKIRVSNGDSFPHLREKQVSLLKICDSSATRPQQTQSQQTPSSQSQTTSPTSSPPSSQLTAEDVRIKEEIEEDIKYTPVKTIKEESPKDIPDASSWTPTEVYNYFKDAFNENVASAFLKQEIDGNSLNLLRRSDVLRGLGFKLGVGLNVLYHVKMLQLKTNDLKTIWAANE